MAKESEFTGSKLSTKQIRKVDPDTENMSDVEIEALMADTYDMFQLAFEVWWQENGGSKYPVGLLTEDTPEALIEL